MNKLLFELLNNSSNFHKVAFDKNYSINILIIYLNYLVEFNFFFNKRKNLLLMLCLLLKKNYFT